MNPSRLCSVYGQDIFSFFSRRDTESKCRQVSRRFDAAVEDCAATLPRHLFRWLQIDITYDVPKDLNYFRHDCCQELLGSLAPELVGEQSISSGDNNGEGAEGHLRVDAYSAEWIYPNRIVDEEQAFSLLHLFFHLDRAAFIAWIDIHEYNTFVEQSHGRLNPLIFELVEKATGRSYRLHTPTLYTTSPIDSASKGLPNFILCRTLTIRHFDGVGDAHLKRLLTWVGNGGRGHPKESVSVERIRQFTCKQIDEIIQHFATQPMPSSVPKVEFEFDPGISAPLTEGPKCIPGFNDEVHRILTNVNNDLAEPPEPRSWYWTYQCEVRNSLGAGTYNIELLYQAWPHGALARPWSRIEGGVEGICIHNLKVSAQAGAESLAQLEEALDKSSLF